MNPRIHVDALLIAFTLGCSPIAASDDEAGVTTSPDGDGDADAASDESGSSSSESEGESSSASSDEADSLDGDFLPNPDAGPVPCDMILQDCEAWEKCVPYSAWGGSWDDTKCVPVQGDQGVGESCHYDGVQEATDDCDTTSLCWDAIETDEGLMGTCKPFCMGTPDTPYCIEGWSCMYGNTIQLCTQNCDPIVQDCDEGLACYWDNWSFSCIGSTEDLPTGSPCGYVNDCAAGNMCIDATWLPVCEGPSCCASFCDLEAPSCPTAGTQCIAFFEEGQAPPAYEQVGLCVLEP